MKRQALSQIVITLKDDNSFKVMLFNTKECVDSELHSNDETIKLVQKSMKRLRVVPGL
jgi:hypothetical protein